MHAETGQAWAQNKYFTIYSDFSRSWINTLPSQLSFTRCRTDIMDVTFHRYKNYSSGKNQASPFSRLTYLEYQLSMGLNKSHTTSLDRGWPPFMSIPGYYDLRTELHKVQLKIALVMFHWVGFSFWVALFKGLQDNLFHLNPEWE